VSVPNLYFLFNSGSSDTPYSGSGEEVGDWKYIKTTTVSGLDPDSLVFTGGGINQFLPTPTASFGSREATMRPSEGTLVIPQTYIESTTDNIMTNVPNAGKNTNRYVFGVYIDGFISSSLYLEAWDDNSFSTTDLPVLSGTVDFSHSMISAVRCTEGAPSAGWNGVTYGAASSSGTRSAYLSGYDSRVRLIDADSATNQMLYFNIYVELPSSAPLMYNQPVISFRYLYI